MSCASPGELSAWTGFASLLVSTGLGITTVVYVVKAAKQVGIAAKQLKLSAQGALLATEASLGEARHRWKSAVFNSVAQQAYVKNSKTLIAVIRMEQAVAEEREAYEQFLNRLDRLCAAVRDKLIPEARAREDYFKMVKKLVEENPRLLNLITGHDNIVYFYHEWSKLESSGPDEKPKDGSTTSGRVDSV